MDNEDLINSNENLENKTGLETVVPNFKSKCANLHYHSEITGEYNTIIIRPTTTEDDILSQYAEKFPKECSFYLSTIQEITKALNSPNGMSREGIIMSLTKIPEIVYTAMKFIDEDYWANRRSFIRFIRKYPRFMIGDHRPKPNQDHGIIIH